MINAADPKAQDVLERLMEVGLSPIDWSKIRPERQLKAVEMLAKNMLSPTKHLDRPRGRAR